MLGSRSATASTAQEAPYFLTMQSYREQTPDQAAFETAANATQDDQIITDFYLVLDSVGDDGIPPPYSPGEVVSGNLVLEISQPITTSLFVSFGGSAQVWWKKSRLLSRQKQDISEPYYEQVMGLLKSEDCRHVQTLDKGSHSFPFRFTLPERVPSSLRHTMVGSYGCKITHKVTASMPEYSLTTSFKIRVRAPLDLSVKPAHMVPYSRSNSWKRFPGQSASILCEVSMPRTGFVLGEYIDVFVAIANIKGPTIRLVTCELVKHVALQLDGNKTKTIDVRYPTDQYYSKGRLNEGHSDQITFSIFADPTLHQPSGLEECRLVTIKYLVEIHIYSTLTHIFDDCVPVVLGTKLPSGVRQAILPSMPQADLPPSYEDSLNDPLAPPTTSRHSQSGSQARGDARGERQDRDSSPETEGMAQPHRGRLGGVLKRQDAASSTPEPNLIDFSNSSPEGSPAPTSKASVPAFPEASAPRVHPTATPPAIPARRPACSAPGDSSEEDLTGLQDGASLRMVDEGGAKFTRFPEAIPRHGSFDERLLADNGECGFGPEKISRRNSVESTRSGVSARSSQSSAPLLS